MDWATFRNGTSMTIRPIIFSAPMVRALIEGRKHQTRRLAQTPSGRNAAWVNAEPGDLLYVRENWKPHSLYQNVLPCHMPRSKIFFAADNAYAPQGRWRPSIHMPRWASRFTLEVTAVRLQRLQDITEADAKGEGVYGSDRDWSAGGGCDGTDPIQAFAALWWKIHGIRSWNDNPAVVALTFTVHQKNVDEFLQQREGPTSPGLDGDKPRKEVCPDL